MVNDKNGAPVKAIAPLLAVPAAIIAPFWASLLRFWIRSPTTSLPRNQNSSRLRRQCRRRADLWACPLVLAFVNVGAGCCWNDLCRRGGDLAFCTLVFVCISDAQVAADVRFWHLADMPRCTAHVRFRG